MGGGWEPQSRSKFWAAAGAVDGAEVDAGGFTRLPAPANYDAPGLVPEEASLVRIDLKLEKPWAKTTGSSGTDTHERANPEAI